MSNERLTLTDLKLRGDFIGRHIGPGEPQMAEMLNLLGLKSLDELIDKAVPKVIRSDDEPLDLPPVLTERETQAVLRRVAERNKVFISMIGMGYHGTIMPPVIQRNVLENPGWYTAYTPYQAEVSQGRLEVLLAYQQMVMDMTGMELANASLLDEATAAAEAMAMSHRLAKGKSNVFFVDKVCHPQTIEVVRTRARPLEIEVVVGDPEIDLDQHDVFGALIQYPGSCGAVRDLAPVIAKIHDKGGLATVAADILALVLLTPPGEMGADIAIGNTQRFGVPMGYGGPHAAYFATREEYKRQMPGRIIGVSVDSEGNRALRMAMQTREQHIRREKATSNICTAQVLLAMLAALYAVYHGPVGLSRIAGRVHRMTVIMAEGLRRLGYEVVHDSFFDTVT
ncbi:MAG: glycine dehydrogenase (aminomethyl-transferring), partial [Alphaproteobacteria bacterium]|nr:glycine dehydrogenase (aminomethyl-transferring) [Alphaproteobacteria bacterium]